MNLTDVVPLPYRVLALVAFAVALAGGGFVSGLRHEAGIRDARDVAIEKQAQAKYIADLTSARKKETDLRALFDQQTADSLKKDKQHAQDLATARARARSGADRLYCPASALPADPAPANPAAASQPGGQARPIGLVPEAADRILSIAGELVTVVRERNDLIDKFNAARATCNSD